MRDRVLTIFNVLLVAAFTFGMEPGAARSDRKVARAHHPATQQLRDAFGSAKWPLTAQSDFANHSERHGVAPSPTFETKSCDVVWCYEN